MHSAGPVVCGCIKRHTIHYRHRQPNTDINSMKTAVLFGLILVVLATLTPSQATWGRRKIGRRTQLRRCYQLFSRRTASEGQYHVSGFVQPGYQAVYNLLRGSRRLVLNHGIPSVRHHYGFRVATPNWLYTKRQRQICCRLCPRLPGCSATHTASSTRATAAPTTTVTTTPTTTPRTTSTRATEPTITTKRTTASTTTATTSTTSSTTTTTTTTTPTTTIFTLPSRAPA
ncbi:putative uncharacterized protein F40H6.5 [Haliotis rufescens]|uniref:putative uncharacterized protein F40H6.5 n=1 Tax=Haliotis rufescens TaxID=6454 RepID=UPI001EB0A5B7|nr:putative uncharacterized protein F40H6.5 [Haliotis rufescens]